MITQRHFRRNAARQHVRSIMRRRRAKRRGVLILVVLCMLVLLLLVGVAFVLTSGQFHSSSRASANMDRAGTSPRALLDDAMHQLLRDTTNPRSVIRSHSLLRDLYGDDGFKGTIASGIVTPNSGGQMLDVTINATGIADINAPWTTAAAALPLSTVPGTYAGLVMTVVSGSSMNACLRIVGYDPSTLTFRVFPISGQVNPGALAQARFVVNGRPFSGTGAGFNPPTGNASSLMLGRCNTIENTAHFGPNTQLHAAFAVNRRHDTTFALSAAYMRGGLDESYDAPDYQNMFLGAIFNEPDGTLRIIPSFHRPDLLNLFENLGSWGNQAKHPGRMDRNRWSLRPSKPEEMWFYPDLPVAASTSVETLRPLDVDNDGDGINDSVWLDLGYPVQVGPGGVLVKPMFAFLCIDLDGRINVNAHGNRWQYPTATQPTAQALAGPSSTAAMPAGQGLGPAEINLNSFLANYSISSQLLLEGNGSWPGRYGLDLQPGINGLDVLSVSKFYDYPANSFTPGARGLRAFGSPADLNGRLGYGLGVRGQILYDQLAAADDDLTNNPYEINLNNPAAARGAERIQQTDMPYSPAELERVLRFADADASGLPSRLWDFLSPAINTGANAARLRRSISTDSFDVPVPAVLPTTDYQEDRPLGVNFPMPHHITELLRVKMLSDPTPPSNVNAAIDKVLSPDLLRGTRMDLNRPFGNAVDDNGDGQVDEPLEATELWTYGVPGAAPGTVAFDYSSAGANANNSIQAKQAFARHLYVLAMLLKDKSPATPSATQEIDFDGIPGNNTPAETARGLAQWAINVVDFRDADSIMTPFEFDLKPFNGWDVDGDISSSSTDNSHADRGLVWGCERPELLLTETMAFHNRNTTDLNTAGAGDDFSTSHSPAGADSTFDQDFLPQGTLMVELYNPWMGNAAMPTELYNSGGVHLNRLSGTTSTPGTSPVWRMLIVSGASRGRDPDDPVTANQLAAADVERSIYFAQPPVGSLGNDGTRYYPSNTVSGAFTGGVMSVPPGSYAVVGSSGTVNAGNYDSPIGQRIDGMAANLRTIRLTPPTMSTQLVVSNAASPADPAPPRPVIAVPIDSPRSVSVSEPVAGYTTAGLAGGRYTPPLPVPLDNAPLVAGDTNLMANATVAHHRTLYLQRLANPMLDYDADTNPYLTIDMMPINLTTFNGATNDPEPSISPANTAEPANFATVERGNNSDAAATYNLWRQEPLSGALRSSVASATNDHFFNMVLKHSLGFLNSSFGPTPSVAVGDTGAPAQPFPFLNWNNRPFANQYELLQVPFTRSSRLAVNYPAIQGSFPNPYTTAQGWFANRPNYHYTAQFAAAAATVPANRRAELFRLLDYTHVPSRFLGTEYELNPTTFANVAGFRPPFNRVSAYRDPGKVNINTIYTQEQWNAILDGHAGPTFDQLIESRRGYAVVAPAPNYIYAPNTRHASVFSNPFRSADAALMVPQPYDEQTNPINCTLLRCAGPTLQHQIVALVGPQYAPVPTPVALSATPLFPPPTAGAYNAPLRNSKFAHEGVEHIGNMVTTHSNVYAVWITMGYFEVIYAPPSGNVGTAPLSPVSYANTWTNPFFLWREYGAEMGDPLRKRAFYIIDRSIPVAFEPGQNNNVDNAVILRRFIE